MVDGIDCFRAVRWRSLDPLYAWNIPVFPASGPVLRWHFVSHIRDFTGSGWLECSDTSIRRSSLEKSLSNIGNNGYMLFNMKRRPTASLARLIASQDPEIIPETPIEEDEEKRARRIPVKEKKDKNHRERRKRLGVILLPSINRQVGEEEEDGVEDPRVGLKDTQSNGAAGSVYV
ncbi:hypothetical protein QQF64_003393 [Cirrhinus molitorella]|uniref:Uncharacterized protein n=1 Tax=Cirrhinus molitorella TaxID=172907 RepID=A0ABR3ML57_9TELE